jgi:hypothetical protein
MVQAVGSSEDFCPPINYDALSPDDKALVDQMVADGLIPVSEVIKGMLTVEEAPAPVVEEPVVNPDEVTQPEATLETPPTTQTVPGDTVTDQPAQAPDTTPTPDPTVTSEPAIIPDLITSIQSAVVDITTIQPPVETPAVEVPAVEAPVVDTPAS